MRVGFVVGQFPMLSETFVIGQMAGLLRRGFKVDVVCNGISDYNFADRQQEPLATLLARTRDWWGAAARFRPTIGRLPPKVYDKASTALDMSSVARLNECDVIVAHFGHNGARAARLKKWKRLVPPIVTIFHGYDVGVPLKERGLSRYGDLFEHGALNLTVNDYFRQVLVGAGAPEAKVAVHHMGIDLKKIPYEWKSWRGATLQLISVCRLAEKKGVEYALRALGRLRVDAPEVDWRYTIIGDGPLRPQLEALASELGIASQVSFLGSLPHEEVKQWLKRSHAFVLPSVTAANGDVEGIPVALMEAMAAGLTVVSSTHSGIPELIEDQRTGFLATEKDVETLASRLRFIAERPDECERIAGEARRKVEAEFDQQALDDDFARILGRFARAG
ncbi:putative colanic acid biosynthesis glycosyl transferase (plasmid) [Sinorhizobium fredii NGR234]|uniref:Colanic acid biosynthesis glycosyl transferase n=1 Tax=Sinorhizobium fredii (strain NBRC 101917 / NGR234) TaxID=394 RepID=C3KMG1_SINFN|nr:glycosyltransferase [Sinorhizobium fredii]ACP23576.1 putative colanic acid biosynthesis glycosyl transferase [Sinorhizobium fredii NGR234]